MDDDDVIVLSDSDASDKTKIYSLDVPKIKDLSDSDLSEFEFPNINLDDKSRTEDSKDKEWSISDLPETSLGKTNNSKGENVQEKGWSDSDFSQVNFEPVNNLGIRQARQESQHDSDYESENVQQDYYTQYVEQRANKEVHVDLSSNEDEELLQNERKENKKKGKTKVPKPKKPVNEERQRQREEQQRQKEERQQERFRKQEEAARQKALKQLNSKNRLNINPDYSMKMMRIILDEGLERTDYFTDFVKAAEESEIKYNIESQLIPKSITWNRKVEEDYVNEKHEVCSITQLVNENHVMVIWDCEETVRHVFNDTLVSTISDMKSLVSNRKLFLIIYKIENYFKYQKTLKNRAMQDDILGGPDNQKKKNKSKADKQFVNFPKVSRKKFEECLVEIQLMYNVTSRLIETEAEMVLLIHQYTKSLALLPTKLKNREESSKVDWYVNCDNRDTVKVDKDGNGLKRLWQQQLCQFSLTSLETCEAITSIYKSPLQLMEAYANCSPAEGEMLLKDIPIRRAAGVLTSVKRIGPALSKKIYTMFTTEDGDVYLNE